MTNGARGDGRDDAAAACTCRCAADTDSRLVAGTTIGWRCARAKARCASRAVKLAAMTPREIGTRNKWRRSSAITAGRTQLVDTAMRPAATADARRRGGASDHFLSPRHATRTLPAAIRRAECHNAGDVRRRIQRRRSRPSHRARPHHAFTVPAMHVTYAFVATDIRAIADRARDPPRRPGFATAAPTAGRAIAPLRRPIRSRRCHPADAGIATTDLPLRA